MAIDVHAHLVPTAVLETLEARAQDFGVSLVESTPGCQCAHFDGYPDGPTIRPFFPALLDIDGRIRAMDRQSVEREILSLWTDIFGYGLPVEKGLAWHRLLNDTLADIAAARPDRFSWIASGPMNDAAAAARELERAMRERGAVGAIVAANVEGVNLGECPLDEFWSAAEALSAPVFIHPAMPVAPERSRKFTLNQVATYTYDTTLAVGSLILAGVVDRHPKLKLILSHGGGTLPYLVGRFDRMYRAADHAATGIVATDTPSAYLTRFHYDTILHDGAALRFLAGCVGVGQLVLGTDLPFPPGDPDPLRTLRIAGFSETDIERIGETTPRRLFHMPEA